MKITTFINGLEIGEATTFSDVLNHIGIPSVPFDPMMSTDIECKGNFELDAITKDKFTALFGKPMYNPEKDCIK